MSGLNVNIDTKGNQTVTLDGVTFSCVEYVKFNPTETEICFYTSVGINEDKAVLEAVTKLSTIPTMKIVLKSLSYKAIEESSTTWTATSMPETPEDLFDPRDNVAQE